MAGFFNLPSARSTTKKDQRLVKKMQNPTTPIAGTVTMKGSGKLVDRVQSIISILSSKFASKKDKLCLITKEEDLVKYIDACIENNRISIDTETTGLDPILHDIVGFSIYTKGQKAAYIPINHVSYVTDLPIANQLSVEFIRDQFKRLIYAKTRTYWFNAPFDVRFIGNHIGVWFTPYFDASIASRIMNSEEPVKKLKPLHIKYCCGGVGDSLTFDKLFDGVPFQYIPPNYGYLYAASDALYTDELSAYYEQFLDPDGIYYEGNEGLSYVFFEIEMRSMPTFISMEQAGVAIDYEHADKISNEYHDLADKMNSNIEKVCEQYKDKFDDYRRKHPMCKLTDPINFNSPVQLAIILYDIFKIPPPDKRNPRGTGEEILEKIDHPICKAILDNRAFGKVLSTYIDKIPEQSQLYPDKRIHCKFNQYGAACVVGSTSILTDNGSIPIESLFDGTEESGISYDTDVTIINRNVEPEKASHKIVYRDVDTIKVTLRGGYQIEGTPNHPIVCSKLTKEGIFSNKSRKQLSRLPDGADFKMLSDVNIGDIVEIPYGYNIFPTEYVSTGFNDINIKYITEDFAEFLGMYHADGYVKTSSGGYSVVLCNDDENVISRFSELCKTLFNVDTRTYHNGKHGTVTYCTYYKLRELDKYLSKGARNKSMPIDIMRSPKSVICAYIKGMTLDSTVDANRQRMFMTCTDEKTYNFIEQFLLNIGIFTCTRFGRYPKKNNHSGVLCDSIRTYRIGVSGEMYGKFLSEIGFIEPHKILDISEYKHSWYLTYNNRYYAYVKKIEHSRNDVYDLTVPETHSFISNGIISHNTGRVSSNSPNLQNIPSNPFVLSDGTKIDSGHDVRQLFTASPGHILMSCDYSGQEVRVCAHLSNDQKMIQAYRDGKDVYSEIASLAFNQPYEECCEFRKDGTTNPDGKARRGSAKKIVLGVLYGRGIPSIAEQLGTTVQEAQKIYDKVLDSFDGLAKFIEESEDMARKYGYVTTVWGRRRQLPDMQLPWYEFKYKDGVNPNFDPLSDDEEYATEVPYEDVEYYTNKLLACKWYKQREELKEKIRSKGIIIKDNTHAISEARRQCVNARVQGSSADLTKKAQILLYENEELKQLGFRMLIPVHDEIIAECPVENVKRCSELMSQLMKEAGSELCVPLSCDVALFYSWYGEEKDISEFVA